MQDMLELRVEELEDNQDVRKVEGAITHVHGVDDASADLKTRKVWVRYDTELIGARTIADAVKNIGYSVSVSPSERKPGEGAP